MIPFTGKHTTAKVMIDQIDEATTGQIIQMTNHPAFTNYMAIMPDTHYGAGATIGLTMLMGDKLIPNVVGKDINCGMLLMILDGFELTMTRVKLDALIRAAVPFGEEVRDRPIYNMASDFPWKKTTALNIKFCREFNERFNADMRATFYDYKWFEAKCNQIGMNVKRAVNSIGTLGGGNHFIELGKSKETGKTCVTIHTGSRQLGSKVCEYWQSAPARRKEAEKDAKFAEGLKEIKATLKGEKISKAIKKLRADLGMKNKMDKGLEYIEGKDTQGYLADMIFCQIYAQENRKAIASEITKVLGVDFTDDYIETVHNYINFEDFIIRKGAVSANEGEIFILPFNMEDGLLVCKGKGNEEWNNSAPHGAGRIGSRADAKKKFSSEIAMKRMEGKGIYTSCIPVDEVKEAYKDPKVIEEAIEPTADIIDRVIPIMNFKEKNRKDRRRKK
jgi:RNA-splicing ligase RtcB